MVIMLIPDIGDICDVNVQYYTNINLYNIERSVM